MTEYTVIRAKKAEEDLTDIVLYIALKNSVEVAYKIVDEMEKSINLLRGMPYIGSKWKFVYTNSQRYRILIVEKFLIFYHVDEDSKTVYIDRIRHGSISPEQIIN